MFFSGNTLRSKDKCMGGLETGVQKPYEIDLTLETSLPMEVINLVIY